LKADTENMRRKPDLATAAAIVTAAAGVLVAKTGGGD
jgi:anthranilate phosphoribosyltransferase